MTTDRAISILLVEDEALLRNAIARSLRKYGHLVTGCGSAGEAIGKAQTGTHDLLILDINLPDATGWAVLDALRDGKREIPTIVVSAIPPSRRRVQEFQPLGVLHKPFPIDALLHLVEKSTERRAEECGM